jgi:hypothetical protein
MIGCEHHRRAIELALHCSKILQVLTMVYNEYGKSLAVRGEVANPMFVALMDKFLNEHTNMLKTHAEYFDNQNT